MHCIDKAEIRNSDSRDLRFEAFWNTLCLTCASAVAGLKLGTNAGHCSCRLREEIYIIHSVPRFMAQTFLHPLKKAHFNSRHATWRMFHQQIDSSGGGGSVCTFSSCAQDEAHTESRASLKTESRRCGEKFEGRIARVKYKAA